MFQAQYYIPSAAQLTSLASSDVDFTLEMLHVLMTSKIDRESLANLIQRQNVPWRKNYLYYTIWNVKQVWNIGILLGVFVT
jgi:hypothetical protein